MSARFQPAERVAFVDDAEWNVRGARAVGLHALLHTDAATTRTALSDLVAGLTASHRFATQE